MKAKKQRIRGLGKSALLNDMRKVIAATTIAPKLKNKEIEFLFKLVIATIKTRLVNGDRVSVAGFGTFLISNRKGRIMTQAGGKKITVPDYRVLRFKPAGILRKIINGKEMTQVLPIPQDLRIVAAPKKALKKASSKKKQPQQSK